MNEPLTVEINITTISLGNYKRGVEVKEVKTHGNWETTDWHKIWTWKG